MARIRSIKPDFWKSEAIAALPKETRLTFIGLWSYVDDNGVGLDNEKLITAELYPLEEDPRETLASVHRDLALLQNAGRITRYTVAGKRYLSVTNWNEHQKIDRPGKPRYPQVDAEGANILTSGNAEPESPPLNGFATPSRQSRETLDGHHLSEQGEGVEGRREQGAGDSAYAGGASASRPDPVVIELAAANGHPQTHGALALARDSASLDDIAQRLVVGWIALCPARPHSSVIGIVRNQITSMLDEGIPPAVIEPGLAVWQSKGLRPQLIPQVVHETTQVGASTAHAPPSAASTKAAGWLSMAPSAAAHRQDTDRRALPGGQS